MTATLDRPPGQRRTRARHAVSRSAVRRRRWSSSWLAALRLAQRDALRHKGSSLLIMIMVGLPVLIISAGSAAYATQDVSALESVPVALGQAQAKIIGQQSDAVVQRPDGSNWGDPGTTPSPVPGHANGEPWTVAQLAGLTGGRVTPVGYPVLFAERSGSLIRVDGVAVEQPAESGLATLTEGRWPSGPAEVAVTPAGVADGLPRSGPLSLRAENGSTTTVQITGIVDSVDADFDPVGLLVDPSWLSGAGGTDYLIFRAQPVSWTEVQSWNQQGLVVLSRQVLDNPPKIASSEALDYDSDALGQALIALICLGLVLETTLLAGPAFAVSAARRRRSLALIGSNGAEPAQLSRYVLAQGLVLGGVAALIGGVAGTVVGWAALRAYGWVTGNIGQAPLDFLAALTGLVVVAAAVAALVAAAIPARGAAKLAVAGSLAGHDRPTTSGRVAPLIGAGVMIIGLGGVLAAVLSLQSYAQLYTAGIAAALLVLGSIPTVPLLLRGVSSALSRAPVPLRMAARDAARSRSRSSSAIAAITVAVAVLTIIAIANASDDAQNRRDYQPHLVLGHGSVNAADVGGGATGADTVAQIRRAHPDWTVTERGQLGGWEERDGTGTADVVAVVPPGCTAKASIVNLDDLDPAAAGPCARLGSNGGGSLMALPLSSLRPEFRLTAEQQAVLTGGGLLVSDPAVMAGGSARLAVGTYEKPAGDERKVVRTVTVPAATMTVAQLESILGAGQGSDVAGTLMLPASAASLRLPVRVDEYEVVDPRGPISAADEKAINDHAIVSLEVERGYTSSVVMLIRVLIGVAGALVAVAALISTALAQVESQADLATMSALGAAARFRRWLAGSQAMVVALTGALLGVVLGFGPGLAFATSFTTDTGYANGAPLSTPRPIIVIPWVGLGLVVAAVPLAAALVAALAVRRRPVMTRRIT